MLKRTLYVAVVLGVLASTAVGAGITYIEEAIVGGTTPTNPGDPVYGNTPYLVGSLSSDGRFVGITRAYQLPDLRWFNAASVYDTMTNTYGTLRIQSGHGSTRGVENLNGLPLAIVAEGNNNAATWKKGTREAGGETAGYLDGSAVGLTGNSNAMAMDANGNGWMVGGTIATNNARGWRITNGVVNATAAFNYQSYDGKNIFNGVSVSGLAVGNFQSGGDRPYLANLNGVGTDTHTLASFGSDNHGQANAISSNGLWAGGYFLDAETANISNGFRNAVDATLATGGVTEKLFPFGFDPDVAQQSNVFDIANDGTAVGFSYDPTAGYRATLWAAGSNQGVLVFDILTSLGVDMSEWQSLERVVSISDDGLTIAGRGVPVGGGYGAFVAVIPEPVTIGLFVLGLPLLRRRR